MDKRLEEVGCKPADTTVHPRLTVQISGLEKQGKTHFALSAPGPILVFNSDIGLEGVVHKFASDKEIIEFDMFEKDPDRVKVLWDSFLKAYQVGLQTVRTVIWDTATEIWDLLRTAKFGRATQIMPFQYGPLNAEYRRLLRMAFDSPRCNLLLLHKLKPVYINDKRTTDYAPAGFGETGYLVQLKTRVYREEGGGEFHIYIEDSRHEPELAGEDFEGALCSFPLIASMCIPSADPGVWE